MRRKLYLIIEPVNDKKKISDIYDFVMLVTIIISIIPLAFKENNTVFQWIDYVTVVIFYFGLFFKINNC